MSRIIEATCENGVVKVGGLPITEAIILGLGTAPNSVGALIIDGDKSYFITSNASDLNQTLTKLISVVDKTALAVTKVATMFTSIGAGMTGPTTAPPGTLVTDVAALNTKVTELNALKTDLQNIQGDIA